jgi:uncharacterized membrane protein YgcG
MFLLPLHQTGDVKGQFRRYGSMHLFAGDLDVEDCTDFKSLTNDCSPFLTFTELVTITSLSVTTETETTTITTTGEGFSCPTTAITNSYGNVLSLVSSCSLEFFITVPASTSTSGSGGTGETSVGASGGSSGGTKSSATSSYFYGLSAFLMLLFL